MSSAMGKVDCYSQGVKLSMTCCCPVSDLIPTRYLLPSGGRYGEAWSEVWGGFVRPVVLDVDSRTCPRSCAEFDAIGVVFPSASLEVCGIFSCFFWWIVIHVFDEGSITGACLLLHESGRVEVS